MKGSIKVLGIAIFLGLLFAVLSVPTQAIAWLGSPDGQPIETPQPVVNPYFSNVTVTMGDGASLEKDTISGPPHPPPEVELQRASVSLPVPDQMMGTNSLTVPAYDWVYGCSAVSSAMIAGYYDNMGYSNLYTGPTNGGVAPLDSTAWGHWSDGYGEDYPNNPLVASHQGVDGKAIRGSLDDYWVEYNSTSQDPYITGGWLQHAWGEAVGDFMKTSQSAYGNTDGSTEFYTWLSSSAPLTCSNMESEGISTLDGTYGRKLFYQARGYTVTDCYNQKTDNNGGGFTFAMYKAEIDAGRPVLLNLAGHSIVGVGYNTAANTVYLHDTWDYKTHTMTWGGSYYQPSLVLQSVSIVNLAPAPTSPFSKVSPSQGASSQPGDLTLSWQPSSGASSYEYCYDKTDDNACGGPWTNVGLATSAGIRGLDSGAAYYWQVRARGTATTEANGNAWWSFNEAYRLPTISGFSPGMGFVGTSVAIAGTNFTGATAVGFNGVSASFTIVSAASISAVVPQGAASEKITVSTPGGTATSSSDFTINPTVTVQFSAPTYTALESAGPVSIPLTLTPSSSQTVTVNYTTSNGTAAAGEDYKGSSGILTFPAGTTTQLLNLELIDDALDEPDGETVVLTLSNPVNAVIAASSSATLAITDNDAPPVVHFSAAQAWVNESNGTASISVTLSAPSGKTVSIGYASSDGTASAGHDYTSAQGVLTFNPGQVIQNFTIPIIDDAQREPVEIFTITLSDPANTALGSPASISVMIVDNDPLRTFIPLLLR